MTEVHLSVGQSNIGFSCCMYPIKMLHFVKEYDWSCTAFVTNEFVIMIFWHATIQNLCILLLYLELKENTVM
jgi:hypothetical protein